ncbi:MAG: helix-turn-helix transcriptional regulator [Dehalococcoidia bacterium]
MTVHWTYLSGIERGKRNPSLKNISVVAAALGIMLSELFLPTQQRKNKTI